MHESEHLRPGKLPGELLNRLLTEYRTPRDADVIVGSNYGFDAAALTIGGETLLVKSDPITFATTDAARYLVAVNANDIACLGGIPRWMTVVALLPEGITRADVEQQFAELQRACEFEGISLIGGHTEVTVGIDRPILVGTLLGTVGPSGLLEPGNAKAGDELWLTQSAGIEGTALLASEREDELTAALGADMVSVAKGLLIEPGLTVSRDARSLLATGNVTALHDPTEGGAATAIHEMAAASGLGAEIDGTSIPVLPETMAICDHFGIDPLGLLSSGALLVASPPGADFHTLVPTVMVTRIGTLTDSPGTLTITTSRGRDPLPRFDSDEITRALA